MSKTELNSLLEMAQHNIDDFGWDEDYAIEHAIDIYLDNRGLTQALKEYYIQTGEYVKVDKSLYEGDFCGWKYKGSWYDWVGMIEGCSYE